MHSGFVFCERGTVCLLFDSRLFFCLGTSIFSRRSRGSALLQYRCSRLPIIVTETVEGDIRKDQHTREIKYKETGRNQIKENMNVTVTDTVESGIRKDQHNREIKYKETGRNQIKENTNFDMARSLFGGGGGGEEYEEESEEEQEAPPAEEEEAPPAEEEEEEAQEEE